MVEPPRNAPGSSTAVVPWILFGCAVAGVCLLSTCLLSIVGMQLTGGEPLLSLLARFRVPGESISPPPARDLLLGDDFRDNRIGWNLFRDATGSVEMERGRLVLSLTGPDRTVWATAPRRFADFRLEVDSGLESGPDPTVYGIIFRHVDDDNFYLFEIDGIGSYRLGKVIGGAYTTLIDPTGSDRVQPGQAMNRLQVTAIGSRIVVGVNGVDVGEITDRTFAEGAIGVSAALDVDGQSRVVFGNLQISRP